MTAPTPDEIRQAAIDIATELLAGARFDDVDTYLGEWWPDDAIHQALTLIRTRLRVEIEELHDE